MSELTSKILNMSIGSDPGEMAKDTPNTNRACGAWRGPGLASAFVYAEFARDLERAINSIQRRCGKRTGHRWDANGTCFDCDFMGRDPSASSPQASEPSGLLD